MGACERQGAPIGPGPDSTLPGTFMDPADGKTRAALWNILGGIIATCNKTAVEQRRGKEDSRIKYGGAPYTLTPSVHLSQLSQPASQPARLAQTSRKTRGRQGSGSLKGNLGNDDTRSSSTTDFLAESHRKTDPSFPSTPCLLSSFSFSFHCPYQSAGDLIDKMANIYNSQLVRNPSRLLLPESVMT